MLRRLRAPGAVVCPLSSTHVMETAGNPSERHAAISRGVREELSDFTRLLTRDGVMEMELEELLAATV